MKDITIEHLDTPSLLIDADLLERNVLDISSFAKEAGITWRPHIKTHKSVEIAKLQMKYGATGITVAKISEAEVMAFSGISNILIAYPVSSPQKIARLLKLLEMTSVIGTIDSWEQAMLLHDALVDRSAMLEVWIKINSGLNRCGVEPGEETLALAKKIQSLSTLKLTGLYTHAGHAYAAKNAREIESIALSEAESVVSSAELCESEGIKITHRSVGSTPTFRISGKVKGITEVRPGNAIFYDAIQVGLGVAPIDRCALTVLSSVVGVYRDRIVFDAGSKSLSLDKGAHGNNTVNGHGHVINHKNIVLERLSEEHGIAPLSGESSLCLTDKVQVIPNHACTVMNLFDRVFVHKQGMIIDEWKIDARGKNQ